MQKLDFLTLEQIEATLGSHFDMALLSTLKVFRLLGEGKVRAPIKAYLQRDDNAHTADRMVALPAMVFDSPPLIGTKIIGSHPDNTQKGILRASAVIVLNDPETMHPIAIMPGGLISAMRTLATAGLCIQRLAPQIERLGIVGMGRLGNLAVKWLPTIFPKLNYVRYFSRHACDEQAKSGIVVERTSLKVVLSESEATIIATQAPTPYIGEAELTEKWIIINLSLMDCKPEVFVSANAIVVDNSAQAVAAKRVLKQVVDQRLVDASGLRTISDLLSRPGSDLGDRVLVNPIGLGAQDVHLAHAVWQAVRQQGAIRSFDWD